MQDTTILKQSIIDGIVPKGSLRDKKYQNCHSERGTSEESCDKKLWSKAILRRFASLRMTIWGRSGLKRFFPDSSGRGLS